MTVTRGEDLAVFVVAAEAASLQMALGRGGWNSRIFHRCDDRVWAALVRNLPVAVVVRPGIDASPVARGMAAHDGLRGVPLVVCGPDADAGPGLSVPSIRPEELVRALDNLRASWRRQSPR